MSQAVRPRQWLTNNSFLLSCLVSLFVRPAFYEIPFVSYLSNGGFGPLAAQVAISGKRYHSQSVRSGRDIFSGKRGESAASKERRSVLRTVPLHQNEVTPLGYATPASEQQVLPQAGELIRWVAGQGMKILY